MELLSIEEIKMKIDKYMSYIPTKENVKCNICFDFTQAWNNETPLIEVNEEYYYKYYERGSLRFERKTSDIKELLFWIFKDVFFTAACAYELNNRSENKDCRRKIFQKELELFGFISDDFVKMYQQEINVLLLENPFNDK